MSETRLQPKRYLFNLRGKALNYAIAAVAGTGYFLFGYDQGVMGSLLTLDTFVASFPQIDTITPGVSAHNSTIQGVTIAIYDVGCLLGSLMTVYFGDKLGRRWTIFVGAVIMVIGAAIQYSAFSLGQLIAGRVVSGVGNGFITSTVPMWQSECAKPKDRGALCMVQGSLIGGGIAFSYWFDFAFFFVNGQFNWRFPVAFQTVFCLIILAFILFLPESPRWLIKKNRLQDAAAVFSALVEVPLDDPRIELQIREIQGTIEVEEEGSKGSLRSILTNGKEKHLHRFLLACGSEMLQQITGTNLLVYYAPVIYQTSIGLSPLKAKVVAACNGTEFFMSALISIWAVERFGRRKIMIFGAIGQIISMAILSGTSWAAAPEHGANSKAGIVAAVMLFVFNTTYGIGWLGMPFLYAAEIVSLKIRGPTQGFATATNWVFVFMVVMVTPVSFASIGAFTYLIFACINIVVLVVVYFFYPETAGRSLEQIDEIFARSNPRTPWDVVKISQTLKIHHVASLGEDIDGDQNEKALTLHAEYRETEENEE